MPSKIPCSLAVATSSAVRACATMLGVRQAAQRRGVEHVVRQPVRVRAGERAVDQLRGKSDRDERQQR